MPHTELGLRERRVIEDMLNAKMAVSKIAVELGRRDMTLHEAILRLVGLYVASVCEARFYFIEDVEVQPDGKVCVDYGT